MHWLSLLGSMNLYYLGKLTIIYMLYFTPREKHNVL